MAKQHMTQYKVALWPSALAPTPVAEIDVKAEWPLTAAIMALQKNGTWEMGVIVIMSAEQQETVYDASISHEGLLMYSKKVIAPRQTDMPFAWGGTNG